MAVRFRVFLIVRSSRNSGQRSDPADFLIASQQRAAGPRGGPPGVVLDLLQQRFLAPVPFLVKIRAELWEGEMQIEEKKRWTRDNSFNRVSDTAVDNGWKVRPDRPTESVLGRGNLTTDWVYSLILSKQYQVDTISRRCIQLVRDVPDRSGQWAFGAASQ